MTDNDLEQAQQEVVGAKLEVKDVAGDKHTNTYTLVYDPEQKTDAEKLREFNEEVEQRISDEDYIHYFNTNLKSDKVVSYKVRRHNVPVLGKDNE